jgi:hypothetical protein
VAKIKVDTTAAHAQLARAVGATVSAKRVVTLRAHNLRSRTGSCAVSAVKRRNCGVCAAHDHTHTVATTITTTPHSLLCAPPMEQWKYLAHVVITNTHSGLLTNETRGRCKHRRRGVVVSAVHRRRFAVNRCAVNCCMLIVRMRRCKLLRFHGYFTDRLPCPLECAMDQTAHADRDDNESTNNDSNDRSDRKSVRMRGRRGCSRGRHKLIARCGRSSRKADHVRHTALPDAFRAHRIARHRCKTPRTTARFSEQCNLAVRPTIPLGQAAVAIGGVCRTLLGRSLNKSKVAF